MNISLKRSRCAHVFLVLSFCTTSAAHAWGNEGHRIINRAAVAKLPQDVPAFLRSTDASNEIEYLGPEPDRWRSPLEPELNASQAPDHFIDFELADIIGPLPRSRYEYVRMLYAAAVDHPQDAAKLAPEKVGFQPYITSEVMERLQAALREWRTLSASGVAKADDAKAAQQAAILYTGWLGHYVADGSMPLHTTIQYNGWIGKENPHGYTTEHRIHSQFESTFVAANMKSADVQPLIPANANVLADPFADYVAYLRKSNQLVERVYQLEKTGGFENAGTAESRRFTTERLAAGATMLRDMIYTAWVNSANPENLTQKPDAEPGSRLLSARPY
jgi:hypothetical protein